MGKLRKFSQFQTYGLDYFFSLVNKCKTSRHFIMNLASTRKHSKSFEETEKQQYNKKYNRVSLLYTK